jgi:hypothetical protein
MTYQAAKRSRSQFDPLFLAAIQATEEAIANAWWPGRP